MGWDVFGLGAVAVDDLIYVDKYPPVDTKEPILFTQRQGGGLTGTALVTAARLGMQTAYYGVLGNDELSEYTKKELIKEGVDCSNLIYSLDSRPIHSIVIIEKSSGSRTLFFDRSGLKEPVINGKAADLITNSRVLFLDHTVMNSAILAAEIANREGIPVVADIELGADIGLDELIRKIDHLVIGVEMGMQLSGKESIVEMINELKSKVSKTIVITAGARGCWYAERDGDIQHVPALKVDVVDTVGCGDVFHGAYAASLAKNFDIHSAIKIATITAGIKATQTGGRSGIPSWGQVEQILISGGL